MHHLRLMKGLSYMGAVYATKDKPDVYIEDENKYQRAMKSGYFSKAIEPRNMYRKKICQD